MNNIFAPSWYVFDKVYNNKVTMDKNVNKDGVALGRYTLIRYCERAFNFEERKLLFNVATAQIKIEGLDIEEPNLVRDGGLSNEDYWAYVALNKEDSTNTQAYLLNLKYDIKATNRSYDRMFFRKEYKNNVLVYQEMDSLVIPEDLTQLGKTVEKAENNMNIALQEFDTKLTTMVDTF